MRKTLFILLIISVLSCRDKKKEPVQISNEFKLEFLNEILSDTAELKILFTKDQLISNFGSGYMMPPTLPIDLSNPRKTISHVKFISDTLNILDTIFVKQQMVDNSKLDLNRLADYGFNIFDLKGLVGDNVPYNTILDLADSLNVGTDNYSFLKFSVPIFNKDKTLAYIMLAQGSGGETLILEKVNGKWIRKHEFDNWVE